MLDEICSLTAPARQTGAISSANLHTLFVNKKSKQKRKIENKNVVQNRGGK